ncbi:PREDICTED: spondin-1-like [Ceratosolen solmsi marchali]|uniref:Spondin-1-like n=1 Tax=Ceratosolen solmsi marchali TaxID=326594 RepID=A0AAJ7DY53_9HYME|nr:PREDICTED: spondin-1-like [Ceratosolen solmsi marchali]
MGVSSDNCKISWMETGHKVLESPYILQLSIVNTTGDLRTYFPNTFYDITIKTKLKNHTFTQFYFKIRNKNKSMNYGTLNLREKELSMFHNNPHCINRIIDGPVSLAKLSIIIGWESPSVNSGCIEIRAVIKETDLRYHIVNRTICEDPRVVLDNAGEILKNCCACDEGKYELTFEGLWSRYTHTKYFPQKEWLAVFPTVIGASHMTNYEFWRPYTKASKGLIKYAETGDTVDLELELKLNKRRISTLIKFRGANFQNKTNKSFSSVRVDTKKHVVSLIAKIEPSPDWFVGVSSLELCQPDCTWIKNKILNLYAYDAGSKNGMLYEDIEDNTEPQDVIQNLNTTWPVPQNNIESPFYDETNNTHNVRPLARIYFTRLKGSEKDCHNVEILEDCVSSWSKWSECSAECGIGISKRSRSIIEYYNENNCSLPLEESKTCQKANHKCIENVSKEDCSLTDWGEWTKCVQICGQESRKRVRSFKWYDYQKACTETYGNMILEEKRDCGNPPCPNDKFECVDGRYSNWMEWSPCTHIKGNGIKFRYRTIKEHLKIVDLDDSIDYGYNSCLYDTTLCEISDIPSINNSMNSKSIREFSELNEEVEKNAHSVKVMEKPDYCLLRVDEGYCLNGNNDNSHKYYYDQSRGTCMPFRYTGCGGNNNRFNDEKACKQACIIHGRKIDCEMSMWSAWSICKSCNGFRSREKTILIHPENGGRMCPLTKMHRESCSKSTICQAQQRYTIS